jgi:predicted phage terminase large subunit-like protein
VTSIEERVQEILEFPADSRLLAYTELRSELWKTQARPEQLPPPGDWRIWYLMAGRGAGKSRAAAETLSEWEGSHPPGEYAIIAPTFADGRDTCVEAPEAGLLAVLGPRVAPGGWNRSLGEIHLKSGSKIYVDGADDGALRIQGKNLRGAWCDEVGLWKLWDKAWNESLVFAVRHDPARIVASGTPKMGHGLVRQLVEDPNVVISRMKTSDNVGNLHPSAVAEFYSRYGGTRLGQQELEGEWISALEGDALKRAWWRYYEPQKRGESLQAYLKRLPTFQWVIVSVDTPLKDKESSDYVAIQVWGVDRANRYLLDARTEQMSYDKTKRAITEMSRWARRNWRCQHRVLIENTGQGPELIVDLKRDLGGVEKITKFNEGSKGQRALAAAGDLELGNCFLPGRQKDDLSGPDERSCPAFTISLVEEAAMFQVDGSHDSHDDQVDAWSQCMNWLRSRQTARARTWSSFKAQKSR